MMDHNEKQYIKFLKCMYRIRLHWICCCCRHMVIEQLNELSSPQPQLVYNISNHTQDKFAKHVNEGREETKEQSETVKVDRIEPRESEISVETVNRK